MERDGRNKRLITHSEAIPLTQKQILELTSLLPARLGSLDEEGKVNAIKYAQDKLLSARNLFALARAEYPENDIESINARMSAGDTYSDLETGLNTLNTIYTIADRFKDEADKATTLEFADDITGKILGTWPDNSESNDFNLYRERKHVRWFMEKKPGANRDIAHRGQFALKPELSKTDIIYTYLFKFGVVLKETTRFRYKSSEDYYGESTQYLKANRSSSLTTLDDSSIGAVSIILYKQGAQK